MPQRSGWRMPDWGGLRQGFSKGNTPTSKKEDSSADVLHVPGSEGPPTQQAMNKKRSKKSADDLDSEFSRLFWAAWKEQASLKVKTSLEDPATKAAITFAEAQGWDWAKTLIEASRLDRVGEFGKAMKFLEEIKIPDRWEGLLKFLRGSALRGSGEPEKAIQSYYEALRHPKFDARGYAWYAIGVILDSKNETDEALKAYRMAFEDPSFDRPGYALNNYGVILSIRGEHDAAINAFHKALEDPKYDTPGNAWNNLGNAMSAKGDCAKAIDAYLRAVGDPNYHTPARAWTNLAQVYVDASLPKEAQHAFKKALALPDPEGFAHARARHGLQILLSKIAPQALSPDDRAMVAKSPGGAVPADVENSIIAAINEAGDTQYGKYLTKPKSERDDTLSILRGWSSAVTLLEGSERRWRGGGYFLKWRGFGIVIDPGFDFLRNFHDAGYHGREIHAVLVSHNHSDHNADLKNIDDLRYEIWKRLAGTKQPLRPYVLVWDKDTDKTTKFGIEAPQHRCEPVLLSSALRHSIDLFSEHDEKLPFRIHPFKVQHETKGDVPNAMGMVVELLDKKGKSKVRIGYTADTAYFPELHQHLANCDVLIAHISQPTIDELQDPSKFKEAHLGYRGTARLLKECQPKVALIGEFWAGFTDLRIPLVKGLRQQSGVKAVLPAGLAVHLRLPSLDIECTECHKPTPFAEVKVAPPTDHFGSLAYLCPSCMI